MARTKNYRSVAATDVGAVARCHESENAIINLPPNPRSYRTIDLRPWLGRGLDDWLWAFAAVIRALLLGGNFSTATIVNFNANGVKNFMAFLVDGPLATPPARPSDIKVSDLNRYVAWLRLKYPNGSTAKNYYSALKSLLVGLMDYGFINTAPEKLIPANPFPMNDAFTQAERSLSPSEMQRLASALKTDLVAIHRDTFAGPDSEAIAVLMLLIAMRSGINTTPLVEMTRDCLRPHPFMPTMMLIQTFKRRGKGAQTHTIRQTQLRDVQSLIPMDGVAVLKKALEMTENLAKSAPDPLKNRVWLYRAGQQGWSHKITCMTPCMAATSIRAVVSRHGLLADDGTLLRVTFAALRKTMENRLWRMSDGDLLTVASVMGHSPQVADNHYLRLDDQAKAECAQFIGEALPSTLRGVDLTPTPTGSCKDSLHGPRAPKDGVTHCSEFTHCLGCPSYVIVGAVKDLHRLFSYQGFIRHEMNYYTSDEWTDWRNHHQDLIAMIDQFTAEHFAPALVLEAKALATEAPHPFWALQTRRFQGLSRGSHAT